MVIHYGYDNDKDTFFNTQINAIASRDVNEGLLYLSSGPGFHLGFAVEQNSLSVEWQHISTPMYHF